MSTIRRKFLLSILTLFLFISQATYAQSPSSIDEDKLLASINKLPPPPKSINDVIKLLDGGKIDLEEVKRLTAIADSEPPVGASNRELFTFYKNRTGAAERGWVLVTDDSDFDYVDGLVIEHW